MNHPPPEGTDEMMLKYGFSGPGGAPGGIATALAPTARPFTWSVRVSAPPPTTQNSMAVSMMVGGAALLIL
jgi:hypothetical protein